jgi:hypothetical protein
LKRRWLPVATVAVVSCYKGLRWLLHAAVGFATSTAAAATSAAAAGTSTATASDGDDTGARCCFLGKPELLLSLVRPAACTRWVLLATSGAAACGCWWCLRRRLTTLGRRYCRRLAKLRARCGAGRCRFQGEGGKVREEASNVARA